MIPEFIVLATTVEDVRAFIKLIITRLGVSMNNQTVLL